MVIVSAYFKIPSKQSHSFYQGHVRRFFRSIKVPIIFFTTPEVHKEIIDFGYDLSHVTFHYIAVSELQGWKTFDPEFWTRQKERDPEKYHTPELAVLWFEKKEFVLRAMALSDEDTFIWCDAGCIRDDASEEAAKEFGTRKDLNDGKLHLQYIQFWSPVKQQFYRYPQAYIAGAIQAGNRSAWQNHSTLYNTVAIEYDLAKVSCNSDQYLTQSCVDKQPELYIVHRHATTINPWFFFLAYV